MAFSISVHEVDPLSDQLPNMAAWVSQQIKRYGGQEGEVHVVLCSDAFLLKMNQDFLGHDDLTDIITFPMAEGDEVSGELYISLDRVRENARNLGEPAARELCRVIIHGVLHLLGWEDRDPEQKNAMRAEEDRCLSYLSFRFVPRGTSASSGSL